MDNIIIKLLEIDDKDVFSFLTNNNDVLWEDILKNLSNYLPHKKVRKSYYYNNDLKILNHFGFDLDFEDQLGNTLLMHVLSNHKTSISFDIKCLINNTKKLYHNNNFNRNILFYLSNNLSKLYYESAQDFISGQNLINFIEKHPEFNIQQFDSMNRNLLNFCLLNSTIPYKLFNYLIDKGLSYNHLDSDKYNLLNFFPLISLNKESAKIFIELTKENDLLNNNKFKENMISSLFSFVDYKQNNINNEEQYINWLKFIFEKINDKTILINDYEKLINILIKSKDNYSFKSKKELFDVHNMTIGFLKYEQLSEKLPIKNLQIKKHKI